MATTWGPIRSSSSTNGARVGLNVWTSGSGSSITVNWRLYLWTKRSSYGQSSPSYSVSATGVSGVSGNFSYSHTTSRDWSTNNRTLVRSGSFSVSRSYGSSKRITVSASITGIGGVSGTARHSRRVTVSRRPYLNPSVPTNVRASRTSDESHLVRWSRNTSTARPYSKQRVQRRVYNLGWGNWSTRANLSSTSTSWRDDGTRANRVYQWRIQVTNQDSGWRTSSATEYAYTTPWEVGNAKATPTQTGIKLSWSSAVRYVSNHETEIQHQEDSGSWTAATVRSSVSHGTTDSWTYSNPDLQVTHRFRIRTRTKDSPVLYSDWEYTNRVELAAPPNAPTNLGPSGYADATEDLRLTWNHSPTDGTDQEKFQLRHREPGGAWTTTSEIPSGTSAWTMPADTYVNGESFEWEVRTWGVHEDGSPWSATARKRLAARPTVAINFPADGEIHDFSEIEMVWGYYQEQDSGQATYQIELIDSSGEVIESVTNSGSETSYAFETTLGDTTEWTIRIRVRSGQGLWSDWDDVTFTVEYPLPEVPIPFLQWDRDRGAIHIEIENPPAQDGDDETDATVEAITNDVYRSIDDGPWERIHTKFPVSEEEDVYEDIARNLVPNPRGRNTDGTVTLKENLVPNPRGRDTSGTVTVRENRAIGNNLAGAGWRLQGATAQAIDDGWYRIETTTASTAYVGSQSPYSIAIPMAGLNSPILRVEAHNPSATTSVTLYVAAWPHGPGGVIEDERAYSPQTKVEPGETVTLETPFNPDGDGLRALIYLQNETAQAEAGIVADFRHPYVGEAGPYFDGNYSPNTDFTVEWTGTPGESTSRLVAPKPVGWTGVYGTVYYSAKNDSLAVWSRNQTAIYPQPTGLTLPVGEYTTLVTFLDGDYPETTAVGVDAPWNYVPLPVNGVARRTQTTERARSTATLHLRNSTPNLTYYFRAAVVPGTYSGDWFDGDMHEPDTDLTLDWTGAPHRSTSAVTAPKSVGVEGRDGAISYYSASRDMHGVYVKSGTVRANVLLREQTEIEPGDIVTPVVDIEASKVLDFTSRPDFGDRERRSTVVGRTTVRMPSTSVTSATSTYWMLNVENNREWWGETVYLRMGVMEGTYTGDYFDGHFEDYDEVDDTGTKTRYRYGWEGDDDDSPSAYFIYYPATITVTDPVPHLTLENCYRVTAYSELPSSVSAEPVCMTITPDTRSFCPAPAQGAPRVGQAYLNGGPGYEDVCAAVYSVEIGETGGKVDTVLHRFSGRRFPLEYSGQGEAMEVSLAFTTLPEEEHRGTIAATYEQWKDLAYAPGSHMYRDWMGRRYWVSVGDLSGDREFGDLVNCGLALVRVEDHS